VRRRWQGHSMPAGATASPDPSRLKPRCGIPLVPTDLRSANRHPAPTVRIFRQRERRMQVLRFQRLILGHCPAFRSPAPSGAWLPTLKARHTWSSNYRGSPRRPRPRRWAVFSPPAYAICTPYRLTRIIRTTAAATSWRDQTRLLR
jgi:hypothetical protein